MRKEDYMYMCEFAEAYSALNEREQRLIHYFLTIEKNEGKPIYHGTVSSLARELGMKDSSNLHYPIKHLEKIGVLYMQDDYEANPQGKEKRIPYYKTMYLTFNWTDILVNLHYNNEI